MSARIFALSLLGFSAFANAIIPVGCNEDNCLRAMIREGGAGATPFCQSFTTAVVTASAALPTFASMCTPNAISGISSACSCFAPQALAITSSSSSSPSSAPSTSTSFTTITITVTGPSSNSTAQPFSNSSTTTTATAAGVLGNFSYALGPDGIPVGCAEDNCLRAMIREGGSGASSFCQTFTANATITATSALPTYASMCTRGNAASEVSSACSCYVHTIVTTTVTVSPATSAMSMPLLGSIAAAGRLAASGLSHHAAAGLRYQNSSCNEDNCLRAMIREGNIGATPFCHSFTANATITATSALPTYASLCSRGNPASEVSSACSCYVPAPTSTAICNEDNCLRAMIREGGAGATPFCAQFTKAVITSSAALPTYASICTRGNAVSEVSSACSCYVH